ncbi:MAG TPA: hypothetical protein VFM46_03860 [Pseudomonadales bacterium]|nr:hypothetical protein [Pseudomonadales bacterium]
MDDDDSVQTRLSLVHCLSVLYYGYFTPYTTLFLTIGINMKIYSKMKQISLHALPVAMLWAGVSLDANALPAYSRQTGDDCAACHVGAYGPQLTPHGMKFKIGGYTDSDGKSGHIPLSAMLVANYTHVAGDLPEAPKHYDDNNNFAVQEVSAFLAGKLMDHVGSFTQVTYSDIDRHGSSLDNMDIRATYDWDGTIFGFSLNNNPGVTDPLNTLPLWGFPYTSPDLGGGGPAASVILDDGLGGTAWGTTLYAYTQDGLYGEVGFYRSFSRGQLSSLNLEEGREITNFGNYWHIAYIKDMHKQSFSVGLLGLGIDLRDWDTRGESDNYTDIGVDANYQFLGNREHVCTLDFSHIKEKQNLKATYAAGGSEHSNLTLKRTAITAAYFYKQTYGFSARYFNLSGSADQGLYAAMDENGNPISAGKPDSTGYTLQADWTPFGKESSPYAPWANVRVGLQYTTYSKINGESKNYDGSGRDAKDENTLSLFAWTAI